jgi:hypothetical protein
MVKVSTVVDQPGLLEPLFHSLNFLKQAMVLHGRVQREDQELVLEDPNLYSSHKAQLVEQTRN